MMRYTQSRAALSAHLFSAMLGALLIAANFGPAANAQSFDCRNARFADEKAICQDTRLGGLDKQLADTYDRAGSKLSKEERQEFEKNETAFVTARHRCGGHQGCIEQSYRNRLQELLSSLPDDQSGRSERRGDTKRSDRQKASRDDAKTDGAPSGTDEAKREPGETATVVPERSQGQSEATSAATSSAAPGTRSRHEEPVKTGSAVRNPPSRYEAEAALSGSPPPEKQSRHKRRSESVAVAPAPPVREEPPAASAPAVPERHPAAPASATVPEKHPASGSGTAAAEPSKPPEKRHSRAKHVATDTSAPLPAPADQAQPASKPEIKWVNPAPSH